MLWAVINKRDWRNDIFEVIWGPENLNLENYERGRRVVWEQFIIQVGIALLFSCRYHNGEYTRLFNYDIHKITDDQINAFVKSDPRTRFDFQIRNS